MFKPGDVVRFKGTLMRMTIDHVNGKYVTVLWFDRENVMNQATFNKKLLELCQD